MAKKKAITPKTTKAKTTKKKEKVEYVYYGHKTQSSLFIAEKFVYEMMVYHSEPRMMALFDEKETQSNEFKGYGTTRVLDKNGKRFIQYIELVGAPLSFLEENKYFKL